MEVTPVFNEQGLIPAILQDAETGQVLMLAWMNDEALEKTLQTGEAHFWSRSRRELWHKGATSGNTQKVVEMRIDCDQDALLVRVKPSGPACHTGAQSCFFTGIDGKTILAGDEVKFNLETLFATILTRKENAPAGSYTASLFSKGEDEIAKKIGEEAVEVILAAKGQGNRRLVEELADLTYHALVLLALKGLQPADVVNELAQRHR